MSAQTFSGVSVGGTLDRPTIVNNSGKPIMSYAIQRDTATGGSVRTQMGWDRWAKNAPILPGAEQPALGLSGSFRPGSEGRGAITGYSLVAVLFSDGSFIGPDDIQEIMAQQLSQWRSLARDTQYISAKYTLMEDDRRALMEQGRVNSRTTLAHMLLVIREDKGEDAAEEALARLAALPEVKKEGQQ